MCTNKSWASFTTLSSCTYAHAFLHQKMGKHWKNISIYGRGAGARYTHTVLQVKYCFKFLFLLIDDSSANQRTTPLLVMLSFTPPPQYNPYNRNSYHEYGSSHGNEWSKRCTCTEGWDPTLEDNVCALHKEHDSLYKFYSVFCFVVVRLKVLQYRTTQLNNILILTDLPFPPFKKILV